MSHRITRLSGTTPLPKALPTTLVKHHRYTYPPTRFAHLGALWTKPTNSSRPRRFEHGLFGSAHVFKGYTVTFSDKRTRRFWKPNVVKLRLYSEILDRRLRIRCTAAVLRTIDRYGGLDGYLLKTPPHLLHSKFARILRDILLEMKELKKQQEDYARRVTQAAHYLVREMKENKVQRIKIQNTLHNQLGKKARAYEHLPQEQRELYEAHMKVMNRQKEILQKVDQSYANYLGRKEPAWSKQTMYVPSQLVAPENIAPHMPVAEQFHRDNQDFYMQELLNKYTTKKPKTTETA